MRYLVGCLVVVVLVAFLFLMGAFIPALVNVLVQLRSL